MQKKRNFSATKPELSFVVVSHCTEAYTVFANRISYRGLNTCGFCFVHRFCVKRSQTFAFFLRVYMNTPTENRRKIVESFFLFYDRLYDYDIINDGKLFDNQSYTTIKCKRSGTFMQGKRNFYAKEDEHIRRQKQKKRNFIPTKAEHLFSQCKGSGTFLMENAKEAEHFT